MEMLLKNRMLEAVEAAFHNKNLSMEEIVGIMQMGREVYDLDRVLLVTNKEYKYQLNTVIECDSMGTQVATGKTVLLAKENYDKMVRVFLENPVCKEAISELGDQEAGYALRCAIMQGDNYYGHVSFDVKERREWSTEEVELLENLSYFLLIRFGMNILKEKLLRYERERIKFEDETISSGFFLNMQTGKCHAIKRATFLVGQIQEWEDYEHLLEDYTGDYVDPIYADQIKERFRLEKLKRNLTLQKPSMSMEFPRVVDEKVSWYRYVIELEECDEDGLPSKAYFYFQNITYDIHISSASALNENAYVIISAIDLDTEQYAVYVDNRTDEVKDKDFLSYGGYQDLIQKMADLAIDRTYADEFRDIFSLENLRRHFEQSGGILKFEFPYKVNLNTYWVKMEAVRTQHFSDNGRKVVLYFSDNTEQKNRELQLQAVSQNLEKEHERAMEAEQLAMMDPLTEVYNRAGFEWVVKQYREEKVPIGFALIDVDNFKMLNDTYGHEFGDEVLVMIAKRLKSSFRNEDHVFRLGGDEFALLLYGCGQEAWSSLQMKFSNIHHYLKAMVKKEIPVTLSVGFCQSDDGYKEELMKLADEALYHTKSVGRAGLTQISNDRKILYTWQDSHSEDRRNMMPKTAVIGNWRVEISADEGHRVRLFMDETAHFMMGIPNILTPEESFTFWYERIASRNLELYHEVIEKLLSTGQAECTYHWHHPSQGEITLRAGAKYKENGMTKEVFGYMQGMKDSDVVLSYDDGEFLMQALNRIYFCTYYFDLHTKDYYIVKGHENEPDVKERHERIDFAFDKYVKTFVHPDYQKKVAEFTDLSTLADRLRDKTYIDCDYLSSMKIGWCRTRMMPVKWDADGNLTHAMSMSACIDEDKRAEIEKEEAVKEAMRLQLRVGEIVSKSSVAQTCVIDKETGAAKVWLNAVFAEENITCSFAELKAWGKAHVYEKDLLYYETNLDLAQILGVLERTGYHVLTCRWVTEDGKISTITYHFEEMRSDKTKILMVIEDVSDYVPEGIEWMHQFDILEKVNECIAIYDYDTYDIVYMNEIARNMLGMDLPTLRTKKCYELFGDSGKPCDFCDQVILSAGGNGFMCREVKGTGQTFFLHGCVMEINGRKYRVEQAVPAAEVDASVDQLQGLLASEQKLMNCVQNLTLMRETGEAAFSYLLSEIVKHYDCDRACLAKVTGEQVGTVILEYCKEGQKSKFKKGDSVPLIGFIKWEKVSSLIPLRRYFFEGKAPEEKVWLSQAGLQNLMILSFEYEEGKFGFISVDNVRTDKDDSNWIGTLAFFVANELQKNDNLKG